MNRLTAAAKTEVEAGTNIASVSSKQGANGQTVYTVNADGASVSAGSDNIVVTKGNKDANNVTDYAVDLSKAVKADIAKGVAAKDAVDNKGISFARWGSPLSMTMPTTSARAISLLTTS